MSGEQPAASTPAASTAAASTPAAEPVCQKASEVWLLVGTILGSAMVFIDGTAVNVALAALQQAFDANLSLLQWAVESYMLALTALLLIGGALADRLGRRRVFVWGTVLFALASVLCGVALTAEQLIAARTLQGIGGALLVPCSLALITAHFPAGRRGRAIGIWSAFSGVTAALGPILGGVLVDLLSWRWVFYINVPVAAIVIAIALSHIGESRDEEASGPLDLVGALLGSVGLGAMIFGLIEAGKHALTHPLVAVPVLIGAAGLVAFLIWEHRSANPMMPLALFKNYQFAGANAATVIIYGAFGAVLFFLPLQLIQVLGFSATQAGLASLPIIVFISGMSQYMGGVVDRIGARWPLTLGPVVLALAFFLFSLAGEDGGFWTALFPGMMVAGFGMGLIVAPVTTAVMTCVVERHGGIASAINNVLSRLGMLLAIAVFGAIAVTVFQLALAGSLADLPLSADQRAALIQEARELGGAEVPGSIPQALEARTQAALEAGIVEAFRWVYRINALIVLAASVIAFATIGRSRAKASA